MISIASSYHHGRNNRIISGVLLPKKTRVSFCWRPITTSSSLSHHCSLMKTKQKQKQQQERIGNELKMSTRYHPLSSYSSSSSQTKKLLALEKNKNIIWSAKSNSRRKLYSKKREFELSKLLLKNDHLSTTELEFEKRIQRAAVCLVGHNHHLLMTFFPSSQTAITTKITPHHHHHHHHLHEIYRPFSSTSSSFFSRHSSLSFSTPRFLSSKADDNSNDNNDDDKDENKDGSKDDYKAQRTDKDFAEYLSGSDVFDIDSSSSSMNETSSSSTTTTTTPTATTTNNNNNKDVDEWRNLHRRQMPTAKMTSRESAELHRQIERTQRTNLERARARTARNVRRALSGNFIIAAAKCSAWLSSGSSAMLSEFIHSVVDCGNQSLLLIGLHDSANTADGSHPYGYGKAVYFWALVSALGTFFLGAGISMTHAVNELLVGPSLEEINWQVWAVLGLSFSIDGYVFGKTLSELRKELKPQFRQSFWKLWTHIWKVRDPATLAILLEDGAACLGVVIAIAGIGVTHATGLVVFDGLAGVGIAGLLAAMGLILVRVNHRFLLGHAVDPEIISGIDRILRNRKSIEDVHAFQSQWTGPETFSFKAEVDFDGTFLAAKLMPLYQAEFLQARNTLDADLRVLLSWYAEDVMRTVEREVRSIEAEIRRSYPGAEYIELEPMSKDADRFAIDDGVEAQLKRIEIEALNRFLKSLYKRPDGRAAASSSSLSSSTTTTTTTETATTETAAVSSMEGGEEEGGRKEEGGGRKEEGGGEEKTNDMEKGDTTTTTVMEFWKTEEETNNNPKK